MMQPERVSDAYVRAHQRYTDKPCDWSNSLVLGVRERGTSRQRPRDRKSKKSFYEANLGDNRTFVGRLFRKDLKIEDSGTNMQNGTDLNLVTPELIFPVI